MNVKKAIATAKKLQQTLCFALIFLTGSHLAHAQQSLLGTNLIVNGNAEVGSAGTPTSAVASVPGWTLTGPANVLPYDLTGYLLLTAPTPSDHGFQYFSGATANIASTLVQTISVASASSSISGGNVKFTASAFLGSLDAGSAQMTVAFQNANGQTFSTSTLGPLGFTGVKGMSLQQAIGLVPVGTVQITVTLSLGGRLAVADSLMLVLSPLGTSPASVLGTNLLANPSAELGASAPITGVALNVPGWSTSGDLSVAPYGGTGWISTSDPGPVDRGAKLFCKVVEGPNASMYQDLDLSPAASLIDSGQVTYQISAWLGGLGGSSSPTLVFTFFDWSGNQLASTGQLGPVAHTGTSLVAKSNSGALPAGTRRVHVAVNMFASTLDTMADDIVFSLAAPTGPPVISPGGVISAGSFGGFTSVSPGSWIEIYGSDLASASAAWTIVNGTAPTSVGGVTVSVGGKPAYLDYVSPGQIDALISSDTPTGAQPLTVTNSNGTSDPFYLIVNPTQPGLLAPSSFTIDGKQYVAALFSDNQTFALPTNAIPGVPSRPATAGDVLTIYGVGFGGVSGGFTAGTIVTQQNSLTTPIQFSFGTTAATPTYEGLAPALTGLYQFNVVVPKVAANSATAVSFSLGGTKGTQTLYLATQ